MLIKLFSILSLTVLLSFNGTASINCFDSIYINDFSSLDKLNRAMQCKLNLTDEQVPIVIEINRIFWTKKKSILQSPNMMGYHTALLACWDKWTQDLSEQLTKEQMDSFLLWQSNVDLLSEQII